ncbi:rhomboid family intramembrane serine protease [Lysobacter sp. K5869]|uniref:rhomboid family intramembrane serine protease n=1 Tax=Lysobacter sp. K5869 TaxID=2820808 RepID=UPI001C05F189|nr:rhomboid family intramembrane serine protease [Lysobacter sp. K5869]QWP79138.1 rhomboid family intramembrane serine protease [Lysobacter sp. K5869]
MFSSIPPVTRKLLIANVAVFLLQSIASASETARLWPLWFELWPWVPSQFIVDGPGFMPWQLITSGFMHGGLGHLVFNMLALVMFGSSIEYEWGARRYAIYYFVCLLGSALLQLVAATYAIYEGQLILTLGASGAIYGLLLAYGMLFPNRKVTLLPFPIVLKARTLVIVYVAASLFYGVFTTGTGVAHFAHLGGMIVGWLLIRSWRSHPPRNGGGPRRDPRADALRERRKASKLRVVK